MGEVEDVVWFVVVVVEVEEAEEDLVTEEEDLVTEEEDLEIVVDLKTEVDRMTVAGLMIEVDLTTVDVRTIEVTVDQDMEALIVGMTIVEDMMIVDQMTGEEMTEVIVDHGTEALIAAMMTVEDMMIEDDRKMILVVIQMIYR